MKTASKIRLLLASVLLFLAGCASTENRKDVITTGADVPHTTVQYSQTSPWKDANIHLVRIDLKASAARLVLSPSEQRGRVLSEFSAPGPVLAVLNASFFDKQFAPRGMTRSEGQDWPDASAAAAWPVLACTKDSRCTIHLPPVAAQADWHTVVAGIPALLKDGQDVSAAGCAGRLRFCSDAHPRSAVGLADGGRTLLLVAAEGRRPPVLGLSIPELVKLMRDLGAHDAINLDGGGSSSLIVHGSQRMARPVNEPALRKVGNALMLLQ